MELNSPGCDPPGTELNSPGLDTTFDLRTSLKSIFYKIHSPHWHGRVTYDVSRFASPCL